MKEKRAEEGFWEKGTILQERYQLEEVIGKGGFGITYRARDLRVDVPVAVKEYLSYRNISEKEAMRETRLAAKFYDLEGIAAARDCFVEKGHIFIVLEYVKGTSIKHYLKQHGRMDGGETLEKIRPIMESMAKIHRQGVIHRDISADNLMISREGKLTLVDFGTARFMKEDPEKPYTLIFKRGFAPIEQCRVHGDQGPWTDIYSLCATIYYMITGMIPEDAVERMMDDRIKPLAQIQGTGLTSGEAACIMKGLSVNPEERYPSIPALMEDLYGETIDDLELGETSEKEEKEETVVTHPTSATGYSTTDLLQEFRELKDQKKKKSWKKWVVPIVLLAVCVVGIVVWRGLVGEDEISRNMTQETLSNKTPSVAVQPTETPNATQKPEVSYVIGGYQGMTEAQVKKQTEELRKAGLTITFKEKYSSKKKGHVISQKPAGGRKFTTLSSVELVLTISKGIKPTPKPTRKPVPNQTVKPNKVKTSPKPSVNFSGNLDDILN